MYLGIDLGTGSVKLMLTDGDGKESVSSESYPIEAPEAGFSETDPRDWVAAVRKAAGTFPDLSKLRGIGFSGQMHGFVPLDAKGNATLGKAILWSDQRGGNTLGAFEALTRGQKERLVNAPAAGMTATSLLWLKRERPSEYERIASILFPKDYLRCAMTGEIATDFSDASGSVLYDFKNHAWCADAIAALGLKESYLPPILGAVKMAGSVSARGAELFGLPQGIPVAVGGADAPTGMFGSGLVSKKEIQLSVGTAAQISRPISSSVLPDWNPSLNAFEGVMPEHRYRVAAMLNAGIALEWARRMLRLEWEEIYAELERKDLSLRPDIYFLPYLSGERTPYMNPSARGAWVGLSLHHERADLAFAALLGVACTVRLGLETLGDQGIERVRAVGGSLRYPFWRNLLASVLGRRIDISDQKDVSARGAARIAAVMRGEDILPAGETCSPCECRKERWMDDYYASFTELYRRLN